MFDRRLLATLANEAFEVIQSQAIQKLVLSGGDGHATMEGNYTIRISNRDEYQCKYMYKYTYIIIYIMLFHYFPGYREARLKSCIVLMCLYQSWAPRLSRNCLLKQFEIRKQTAEYIYAGGLLEELGESPS